MIEIVLAHSDLARVRFAHSPVEELVASLRVLQDPRRQLMYGRWLSAVRPRLGGLRLELLAALAPTGRYLPDFLFPPPTEPWGVLAEELDAVAASPRPWCAPTSTRSARSGGSRRCCGRCTTTRPPTCRPSSKSCGGTGRPRWSRSGRGCGRCAPPTSPTAWSSSPTAASPWCWPTCTPDVSFTGDLLQVDKPHHCSHRLDLAGTGIVLLPCAFAWPTLSVDCSGVDQPALIYPRGAWHNCGRTPRSSSPTPSVP
jgi:hypothetical protein